MILNYVKRACAVIFIKSIATLVPVIFPPRALISNKMILLASNWLNLLELVGNELRKHSPRKYLAI